MNTVLVLVCIFSLNTLERKEIRLNQDQIQTLAGLDVESAEFTKAKVKMCKGPAALSWVEVQS